MIRCACESSHTLACRPDGSRRAGAAFSALGLARLQRAHALGGLDGLAGAFGNVFPAVSCGCAGAGRTGASSAIVVALGFDRGDPLIGLLITLVILKITWDSWRTVSTTDPGEMDEP